MADQIAQLATALKTAGQSLTTARRTVFEALLDAEPQTMYELIERCAGVDRASVYRAIALFERLGIVQRLQTGWKYKLELSDNFQSHHHHATCLVCGTSTDLPEDPTLERRLHQLAEARGFQVERHQMELQGYCEFCKTLNE